jgi:hypothetical protein
MMSQRRCSRLYRVMPLVVLFFAVVVASPRAADPIRPVAAVTLKPALDVIAAEC